jgi:hypothetical protein
MGKQVSYRAITICAAAALFSIAIAEPVRATLIVIPNQSFEAPTIADNTYTDSYIDTVPVSEWAFVGSDNGNIFTGVWNPNNIDYTNTTGVAANLPGAASGPQTGFIYLRQTDDLNPLPLSGSLTTIDPLAVVADYTRYDLTVALGNSITLGPGEVTIQLLVDDDEIASTTATGDAIPEGTFTNFTTTFETGGNDPLTGGALKVRITQTHMAPGEVEIDFDNVRLSTTTTAVPEPAMASLTMLGVGATTLRRRRRRKMATK